jgi:hypothetical protein
MAEVIILIGLSGVLGITLFGNWTGNSYHDTVFAAWPVNTIKWFIRLFMWRGVVVRMDQTKSHNDLRAYAGEFESWLTLSGIKYWQKFSVEDWGGIEYRYVFSRHNANLVLLSSDMVQKV